MSDWPYCTHGHANRPKGCVACCLGTIERLEDRVRERDKRVVELEKVLLSTQMQREEAGRRIAWLESALESAPHAPNCAVVVATRTGAIPPSKMKCDCWKAEALGDE